MENNQQQVNENVCPEAYDSPPWFYDLRGFFILTFAYRDSLLNQVRFFANNISSLHLEGAIGTGTLCKFYFIYRKFKSLSTEYKFIGIDYSNKMLEGAVKKLKADNHEIKWGDLTKIDYPDNYFQSANLPNAYHTIGDAQLALREVFRVLKPQGTLCLNVLLYPKPPTLFNKISKLVNKWGMKIGILNRPYTEEEVLKSINSIGFNIYKKEVRGNALYLTCIKQ